MKTLPSNGIEIIGFNGAVLTACGRSQVIARDRPTNRCFNLEYQDGILEPGAGYTRTEIESFEKEGRLTLFPEPVPALPKPMAVYLTEEFVQSMGSSTPASLCQDFSWQDLPRTEEKVWATVADADFVEQRMNEWGRSLESKTDDLLMRFFSKEDQESVRRAERTAKLALCAARDPKLRANIYLGYGAALLLSPTPKRLWNLHQYILRPQFPSWTWDDFCAAVRSHNDILKTKEAGSSREMSSRRTRRRDPDTPSISNSMRGLQQIVTQSFNNFHAHGFLYGDVCGNQNVSPNHLESEARTFEEEPESSLSLLYA